MSFADAFDTVLTNFRERLRRDLATLTRCRLALRDEPDSPKTLEELLTSAHKLAGAAGIFGFEDISRLAASLEDALIDKRAGQKDGNVAAELDAVVACVEGHLR